MEVGECYKKHFVSCTSVAVNWDHNGFRGWEGRLAYTLPLSPCRNKANSDSLLMAYYIVTLLTSIIPISILSRTQVPSRSGSLSLTHAILYDHLSPTRPSLQAIASSLVMMDNGRASIKIRLEQYLRWVAAPSLRMALIERAVGLSISVRRIVDMLRVPVTIHKSFIPSTARPCPLRPKTPERALYCIEFGWRCCEEFLYGCTDLLGWHRRRY